MVEVERRRQADLPNGRAGREIDPPVWVPSASGTSRAATPTPEPLLEPAGVRSARHGLTLGDGSEDANWVVTALPTRIAPAALSLATEKQSALAGIVASG